MYGSVGGGVLPPASGKKASSSAQLTGDAVGVAAHPQAGVRRVEGEDPDAAILPRVPGERHAVHGVEGGDPGPSDRARVPR